MRGITEAMREYVGAGLWERSTERELLVDRLRRLFTTEVTNQEGYAIRGIISALSKVSAGEVPDLSMERLSEIFVRRSPVFHIHEVIGALGEQQVRGVVDDILVNASRNWSSESELMTVLQSALSAVKSRHELIRGKEYPVAYNILRKLAETPQDQAAVLDLHELGLEAAKRTPSPARDEVRHMHELVATAVKEGEAAAGKESVVMRAHRRVLRTLDLGKFVTPLLGLGGAWLGLSALTGGVNLGPARQRQDYRSASMVSRYSVPHPTPGGLALFDVGTADPVTITVSVSGRFGSAGEKDAFERSLYDALTNRFVVSQVSNNVLKFGDPSSLVKHREIERSEMFA